MRADDEKLAREALMQKKRIIADRDRAEALQAEQRAAVPNMKSNSNAWKRSSKSTKLARARSRTAR